jgi:hypothetical protein
MIDLEDRLPRIGEDSHGPTGEFLGPTTVVVEVAAVAATVAMATAVAVGGGRWGWGGWGRVRAREGSRSGGSTYLAAHSAALRPCPSLSVRACARELAIRRLGGKVTRAAHRTPSTQPPTRRSRHLRQPLATRFHALPRRRRRHRHRHARAGGTVRECRRRSEGSAVRCLRGRPARGARGAAGGGRFGSAGRAGARGKERV